MQQSFPLLIAFEQIPKRKRVHIQLKKWRPIPRSQNHPEQLLRVINITREKQLWINRWVLRKQWRLAGGCILWFVLGSNWLQEKKLCEFGMYQMLYWLSPETRRSKETHWIVYRNNFEEGLRHDVFLKKESFIKCWDVKSLWVNQMSIQNLLIFL